MVAAQRSTSKSAKAKQCRVRPEFIAAVRYMDDSRDVFHIRYADDMADARQLVIAERGDIRSLVIAERRQR